MEVLKVFSYFPYDDIPGLTEATKWHLQFNFLQLLQENKVVKCCLLQKHMSTPLQAKERTEK